MLQKVEGESKARGWCRGQRVVREPDGKSESRTREDEKNIDQPEESYAGAKKMMTDREL